jgi:ribosomal protein S18 acetylase RimI-like enzyme
MTASTSELLDTADRYLDAAPRTDAVSEVVGPFVLFKSTSVWSYYARPRRRLDAPITAGDIRRLSRRCDELGIEFAVEWIAEITPSVEVAAQQSGLRVERHALLVLVPADVRPVVPPDGVAIHRLAAKDPLLVVARAVAEVAFGEGGTARGSGGPLERDLRAADVGDDLRAHLVRRSGAELTLTTVAIDPESGVLCTGSLQPVGDVAEILAMATLPSERRRGLAAAVTSELVRDAARRGVALVLLSAQDDAVARVYRRVGFRRIGTHLAAERPG